MKDGLSSMKIFNSDRIKITKSSQANSQTSTVNIINQLEAVRNQIRTHFGEVKSSVDVLRKLRDDNTDNK